MRCATVEGEARCARAISSVVRPHTSRSVSATCASGASAGWQQVKMRRRRSSSTPSSEGSEGSAMFSIRSSPSSSSETSCFERRRRRSIALNRPVETSHARGLSGTPSIGHCSTAATNASCSASSATSKSPSWRMRVARTRRDSAR
jgi:hypothetical protein